MSALTFILKLQDLLTPAMRTAAGVSEGAASKIKSQFTGIEYSGKKMGASVNELRSALQQMNNVRFGTHIKKEFDDATKGAALLQKQLSKLEGKETGGKGGGGGSMLGNFIKGNLIAGGISQLSGMAMSGIGAVIGASAKEEQNKVGLSTFLGKAGANEAYANIKKDAAVTPFDTESLLMSNRALISAGASAKDARRDTMNLANAISAVGGGNAELSRMATNMQQIKTVGKASAMDIKQFAFAGVNIYKLLADATGKNIDQVKEMDVSYTLLSKALQHAGEKGGAYFGAMEAQSQTIGGKWSTFKDNLTNTAADIGTALQPIMHWVLDLGIGITDNFEKILPLIQPVLDIVNSIPQIIKDITSPTSEWAGYINVLKDTFDHMWSTVKSIFGNIVHIVSSMVDFASKSELVKDIFWAIGKFGNGIYNTISLLGDSIQWLWDNLIKPILDKIEWVYSHVKGLFGGGKTNIEVVDGMAKAAPFSIAPQPAAVASSAFGSGAYPLYQPNSFVPAAVVNPLNLNSDRSSKVTSKDLAVGGKDSKSKADGINGGGQRSIVINIAKQIETLAVHVLDVKGGANEIESMVREVMRKVMYSVNGVATS